MNTCTANGVSNGLAGSINYHPFGGISNWTYGNNLQRLTPIDLDGRLTAIHTDGVQGLYYQHNANDEIAKITNGADAGLTQDYAYDAMSRVTSQVMPGNSMTLGYDGVGNRTSRNDNGVPTTYGYPATNHRLLSAATGGSTRWFNTNAIGNIDAWHGADGVYNAMTYDAYLRPKTHTRNGFTATYGFNALDQRVLKYLGGGNSTRYVYAGQNTMLAERFTSGNGIGSQWTSYLWLGGQPVGLVKGNTLYWVHGDHLGRPEMVTNVSQQRVWRAANRAFERGIAMDQIGGYHLGFPGQYYDSESNLWHNGFRDYEPTIGRYMQSDPIGLAGGISMYAYVGGNPIRSIDPLGLQSRTNDWLANNGYNGNNGSLGGAAYVDTINTWGTAIRNVFVGMPLCTLSCGADATIGISPSSFVQNRVEDAGFKALEIGAIEAISDTTEACMSKTAERVGREFLGKVTPGVNVLATGKDVFDFGACTLKCGP